MLKHCSAKPADLINSDGQMASKDTPTIVPDRQLGFKLEFITSLTSYNNLKLGRNPLLSRRRCGLASFFLRLSALPAYAPLFAFRLLARDLGKQRCDRWTRARGERKAKSLPGD